MQRWQAVGVDGQAWPGDEVTAQRLTLLGETVENLIALVRVVYGVPDGELVLSSERP